jgi:hypothetical protein
VTESSQGHAGHKTDPFDPFDPWFKKLVEVTPATFVSSVLFVVSDNYQFPKRTTDQKDETDGLNHEKHEKDERIFRWVTESSQGRAGHKTDPFDPWFKNLCQVAVTPFVSFVFFVVLHYPAFFRETSYCRYSLMR